MSSTDANIVEVTVQIAARPETVFRFLSDPARFKQWMGGGASIAPAVDGALRVQYPDGPVTKGHVASGRVTEWVAGKSVAFTWGYEHAGATVPAGSTQVTITLTPTAEGTRVTLRHAGLPGAEQAGHRMGWRHYLSMLAGASTSERLDAVAESIADRYVAAWNEPDDARRMTLLTDVFAERGAFRDAFGCVDGRAELSGHIANALRMTQGARLERVGRVQRCDATLRYAWRVVFANGVEMAKGENVLDIDLDGRISRCLGFWDAVPGMSG